MSIIVIDKQVVHYEVFGRGQPVLFLHGFHGSWRYWYPTMEHIAQRYRTYSFDFWGFGESRLNHTNETIQAYSDQVIRFLDQLGIEKVLLVGHSMGGMVATRTAIDYPDRVLRLATVSAPISGDSLSWMLKLLDNRVLAEAYGRVPWLRRAFFRSFLGENNDPLVHEVLDDSVKGSAVTLRNALGSMWRTDLRPDLNRLHIPTLVVHGKRDQVVRPDQAELFSDLANAEIELLPNARHFPFLEEPAVFNERLGRFLAHEPRRRKPLLVPRIQPAPIVT
jgi:pimeloyl-ACP methyl ester carboxylesterase